MPVVTAVDPKDRIPPRTLIIGIELNGIARAYPFPALEKQRLILDQIGATQIMLLLADDGASVRAFDRRLQTGPLEFFLQSQTSPLSLVDAQTGSAWDFSGKALSGPSAGASLRQLPLLKDYWFDWKTYHPATSLYALGPASPAP